LAQAESILNQVIDLDPGFAAAYAVLAENHRQEWMYGWHHRQTVLDEALEYASKAVDLDDKLPIAHSLLGWIHLWRKNHDAAEREAQLAVQLDPNFAEGYARLGHIVDLAGRPLEAIDLIKRALRLDPHSPFIHLFWLGHAYASLRQDKEAVDTLRRAAIRNPDHIGTRHYLAASLWYLGYLDEAKAQAEALLRVDPNFSVSAIAGRIPHRNKEVLERHVAALRALGVPD
jgi:tetratricopeptide (TPR) repeat protein